MRRPTASSDRTRFAAFDVVVVPFPYADRLAEKRRPALVISSAKLLAYGLVWVSMITSAENEAWPGDVTISNLGRAGLPAPSVVRPPKIACIEASRIDRRVGSIDKPTARVVLQRLRGFIGGA
jgi:mRNA interferase MazF